MHVLAIDTTPLRRRRRLPTLLLIMVVMAGLGATATIVAANRATGAVRRVPGVGAVLSAADPNVENYLLVGSDSRANSDPNSPDFGGIGTEADVQGSRSDTIMVLRRDKRGGPAALLSIPRDLWVEGRRRINSAYVDGPATLVQVVQRELGVPIHHYVEIDFSGFKDLVTAVGGVTVCFAVPTRDLNTGLNIVEPGCYLLDGVQGLAYARSRYYEEFRDGEWHTDPTSDLGRTMRQRQFVDLAVRAALHEVKVNPFAAGDLVRAITASLSIDQALDPIVAGTSLREAVDGGLASFALPVVGKTIDNKAVLVLGDGAQAVLDYFRGTGPAPEVGP